jgi:hypothetical protein
MWYILHQMNLVKPQVIYKRRKARQGKLARSDFSPYLHGSLSATSDVFNPTISDFDIPLTTNRATPHYQQWDKQGRAVGYVGDPQIIHTPKPQVGSAASFLPSKLARDAEERMTRPLTTREDSGDSVDWDVGRRNTHNQSSIPIQPTFQNAYDSSHQRSVAPEMGQTPTQASFVNDWPSSPTHPNYRSAPRSPFEEAAYGGYEIIHTHGHTYEPTDSAVRIAYSSSPVHDDDLASHSTLPGHKRGYVQAHFPPPLGSMNLR